MTASKPARPGRAAQKERVRHLVFLDAAALMKRLDERRHEMIALFSRHRDREPLLAPLRSWVPSASFQEIVLLAPAQQAAVSGFYEALDELRWYFRYTNDMPGSAQQVFEHHLRRLAKAHQSLEVELRPAAARGARPAVALRRHARRKGRRRTAREGAAGGTSSASAAETRAAGPSAACSARCASFRRL
jgi:hypothetical protein